LQNYFEIFAVFLAFWGFSLILRSAATLNFAKIPQNLQTLQKSIRKVVLQLPQLKTNYYCLAFYEF